jgi:hypothetical protein
MNALIDQLQGLDGRLSKLEGASPATHAVMITQIVPSAPVRIGDDLEIQGSNFDFGIGAQRVYFDSTRAQLFRNGSSDSRLIVQVPNVPNVSPSGTTVTLLVTNQSTSTSRSVTLLPVNQQGNAFISFTGNTPLAITPGQTQSAVFSYGIDCQTLLPLDVSISASISISNWQSLLQIVSARSGQVLPNGVVTVQPNQTTPFNVVLPQLPTPAGNPAAFTLSVALSGPGIIGTQDGPRTFTFGVAGPQPDPTITTFTLNDARPAITNNTILVSQGQTAIVQLAATFTQDGAYNVTSALAGGASNWLVAPTTLRFWNKDISPILVQGAAAAPQSKFPAFDVTPQAGATSGQLVFTVQRQNAPVNKTTTFVLQLGS